MEMKNSENLMTPWQMNNSRLLLNLSNNKIATFSQTMEEEVEEECKWIVGVEEDSEELMAVEEDMEWEEDKWVNVVATITTVVEEVVSIMEDKVNSSKNHSKAPEVPITKL